MMMIDDGGGLRHQVVGRGKSTFMSRKRTLVATRAPASRQTHDLCTLYDQLHAVECRTSR